MSEGTEKKTRVRKSPEQRQQELATKIGETGERLVALCRQSAKLNLSAPSSAKMQEYLDDLHKRCTRQKDVQIDYASKIFGTVK